MKQAFKYCFQCINPVDYELSVTLNASGKLFRAVLDRLIKVQKLQARIDAGQMDLITEYDIPPSYHFLIKTAVGKIYGIVLKEIDADNKIRITSDKLARCKFTKNNKDWDITLTWCGQYIKA